MAVSVKLEYRRSERIIGLLELLLCGRNSKFGSALLLRCFLEKYEQLKASSNVQEGPSMFERPAKVGRVSGSTSAAYTSPVVTELQGWLQSTEDELQTTRAELLSTREKLQTTKEELAAAKKQIDDTRLGLLELNARFDSFSSLLGHPTTRAGPSQDSR